MQDVVQNATLRILSGLARLFVYLDPSIIKYNPERFAQSKLLQAKK